MTAPRNAVATPYGRTYRWGGQEFDSVTTLLSGGVPKPALTSWAAKSVAEFVVANLGQINALCKKDTAAAIDLCKGSPWRQRDKAADVGSKLHSAAEAHVLGTPMTMPEGDAGLMLGHFVRFLEEWRPRFEATEATVYSRRWSYAGTLDAIIELDDAPAELDGRRFLVDYKSGKGVYSEVGLQLAAYRYAEFLGLPDGSEAPVPDVDGCLVVHIRPDGYNVLPIAAGPDEHRMFLYAAQVARWSRDNRHIVGAALAAPRLEASSAHP